MKRKRFALLYSLYILYELNGPQRHSGAANYSVYIYLLHQSVFAVYQNYLLYLGQ